MNSNQNNWLLTKVPFEEVQHEGLNTLKFSNLIHCLTVACQLFDSWNVVISLLKFG